MTGGFVNFRESCESQFTPDYGYGESGETSLVISAYQ
jgi:hypothetical protein